MSDFLLRLFGIQTTGASRLVAWQPALHGINPAYVLVAALLLGTLVFWMYRRSAWELSATRRAVLTALRAVFLLLILGLLLRPVLAVTFEQSIRRSLLILIDTSASMSQIQDQRTDEKDLKRAAIARGLLDPAAGMDQPLPPGATGLGQPPRIDLVKAALKNMRLDLLPRLARDYDLNVYAFDGKLAEIPAAAWRGRHLPEESAGASSLWTTLRWLVPLVLLLGGLAALGAGYLIYNRPCRLIGAGVAILGILAGIVFAVLPGGRPAASAPVPAENLEEVREALNLRWIDGLEAKGAVSAVGDAVREVISRKRGQPIAGVLLISDGASNSGVQPLDAARLAGQDKVPLYIWGVGITAPRDIIVGSTLFAPEIAFVKDEVPVGVRVRSMGMAGQTARVVVTLGDEKAEKDVEFNADGETIVTVSLTPKKPGELELTATVPPREDELIKDNNSASQRIRVIEEKIKVLYLEQSPRWEFKYVQAALMRDRRVDFKCVLLEGDPAIARGEKTPYLEEFPKKKEDLFKYDVLIMGDVDPKALAPAQVDMIGEFVSRFGGALVIVAGKRFMPVAWRKTLIEKLLPVELDPADAGGPVMANRPFRLELAPAGKASPMLRLAEREFDSMQIWGQFPPIYWTAKVARPKPAAEVLVVDPDPAKASRQGKMPVVAIHGYGMGQVLYVGTDNLWRWRKNAGDKYHAALWGQMIQRMALPHLLGGAKRTQLSTDQKEYTTGQPVTIYARLYTDSFEPMTQAVVNGSAWNTADPSRVRPVQLRLIPDQPGMYRGQLSEAPPGKYEFVVDHDRSVKLEFAITDPRQELADPAMNEPLLRRMADASGGRFFREEDLHKLPEQVAARSDLKRTTMEADVAFSPFYFLLMLIAVTAEWIIRKISQLK